MGAVAHASIPNSQEAEAGRSWIWYYLRLARPHLKAKQKFWVGKTAQWGRALAIKPDSLALVLRTHMVEGGPVPTICPIISSLRIHIVKVSIAVKNTMTWATLGKHLNGAASVQRFSPWSSWQEAWRHAGRHGAGGGAESFNLDPQAAGRESYTGPGLSLWHLKARSLWHTSSN